MRKNFPTKVDVFGSIKEHLKINTISTLNPLKIKDQIRNLGVMTLSNQIRTFTKTVFHNHKNISRIKGLLSQQDLEHLCY